jgi:hypothetical protein
MAKPITFDHSIYSPDAVQSAAEVYAELLNIGLESTDGATQAVFSDLDPDNGQMLIDAFCNHVLFDSIQRHRATEVSA